MAINTNFEKELRGFERDRGIKRETMLSTIVDALQAAARKSPFCSGDVKVTIDPVTLAFKAEETLIVADTPQATGAAGSAYISLEEARKINPNVSLGEKIQRPIDPRAFGRISAQMAKQALVQGIHASERDIMQSKYADKVGRIVTVTVRQIYHKDSFCDLDSGGEAILKSRDRMKSDRFTNGDTIRAVIRHVGMEQDPRRVEDDGAGSLSRGSHSHAVRMVDESAGNPCVKLSRTDKLFLKALLFEQCSEIKDGTVEIISIARQPGIRSKVAVRSNDPKVDPIGACVGVRGSRIRPVISELNGEKIDIVPWSDDFETYVRKALLPAMVLSVDIDYHAHQITVFIDKNSLTPLIGKLGMNTRLASELLSDSTHTTWTISARELATADAEETEHAVSAAKFQRDFAAKVKELSDRLNLDSETVTTVIRHGYLSPEGIMEATLTDFVAEMGRELPDAKSEEVTSLREETARAVWAAAEAAMLAGSGTAQ